MVRKFLESWDVKTKGVRVVDPPGRNWGWNLKCLRHQLVQELWVLGIACRNHNQSAGIMESDNFSGLLNAVVTASKIDGRRVTCDF